MSKFRNKQCLNIFIRLFLDKTTKEIYNYVKNVTPIYNGPLGNVGEYYYSAEELTEIFERVLLFQCDDKERVIKFLVDLLTNFR